MPKYFPITRTVEAEGDGAVDVEHEDSLLFEGDPIIVQLNEFENLEYGDSLSDNIAILDEDYFDLSDWMEMGGDADAEDALLLDSDLVADLEVTDSLIFVNEPWSANPDVADFYYWRPRIADTFVDVGEVIEWDPIGVGRIEMTTTATVNSGRRLGQIRADSPDSSFITTPASNFQNDFRANTDSLGNNERMVVVCFRLQDVVGVQWGGSMAGSSLTYAPAIRNTSVLTARNATCWVGWVSAATQPYVDAPTWNNVAAIRTESAEDNLSTEGWHNGDVPAGSTQARGIVSDDVSSFSGRNLWVVQRQFEGVLSAGEMRVDQNIIAEYEFTVTG